MAERSFSNDELRLYELLQQFLALSDSTEHAGTLILIGPKGTIVGDCVLSADDIETATDALLKRNIERGDQADPPAQPLLRDEDDVDPWPPLKQDQITDELVDALATEFEEFLKSEGGQA